MFKIWIDPPHYPEDEEKSRQVKTLFILSIYLGIMLLAAMLFYVPIYSRYKLWAYAILLPMFLSLLAGRVLFFQNRGKLAVGVVLGTIYIGWICITLFSSGPFNPALFYLASVILITGMIYSIHIATAMGGLAAIILLADVIGIRNNLILPSIFQFTPVSGMIAFLAGLLYMSIARNLFVQNLTISLKNVRQANEQLHKAQNSLSDSEEQYRLLVETAPDAIIILVDGRIAYANPACTRLLHLEPDQALTGKLLEDLVHPSQSEEIRRRVEAVTARGMSDDPLEEDFLRQDGSHLFVEARVVELVYRGQVAVQLIVRDISSSKAAQRALGESQALIEAIFNSSDDLIWSLDAHELRLLSFNRTLAEWFQANLKVELKTGLKLEDLFSKPEHVAAWRQMHQRALDAGPYTIEHKSFLGNEVLQLHFNLLMREGSVFAISVFGKRITNQLKLENALRTSEAQFRRIFETANEGVSVLDTDGRLINLNPRLGEMLGYSIDELLGRKFEDLVDESEILLHRQQMHARAHGKASIYERRLVRKNGQKITVSISGRAMLGTNGEFQGSFGMVSDITARKQAEAELSRMALALDVAPSAIIVHDFEGNFLYANQYCLDLHQYSREEFLQLSLCDLLEPDMAAGFQDRMRIIEKQGESSFEVRHIRKDGVLLPLAVSVRLTLWGEQRAFLSIATDMTERKKAEQVMRDSEERLRAVVQTANEGILTMDKGGKIFSWNPAARNIFGYSSDEALGMPVQQIIPGYLPLMHSFSLEDTAALGGFSSTDKTLHTYGLSKEGRQFPIELSPAEWKMQDEVFYTILIRDVSERHQRQVELQAIATLSAALRAAQNLSEMLPIIVDQLKTLLSCDSISVEIIDPVTGDAVVEAANGYWLPLLGSRQPPRTGANAIIAQTRSPYWTNSMEKAVIYEGARAVMEKINARAGVPLTAQDQLFGFLWMGRQPKINESDVRLLAAVADIAANAMHRAALHERTQKNALDLSLAYNSTLEGWAHALELRDQETEGHTRRVVDVTVELAQVMGITGQELENIRRGALLHDIGKMGIPDSVLLKPGTLNEREWEIMRRHPEYAYKLLEPISYLRPVLDIPFCHHEKWDGSGYPNGLKGEQIPLGARIFAIVDVWDALCSDRPYRAAWRIEQARQYILEQSGRHFDPQVVAVFLAWLDQKESSNEKN